MQSIINYPHKLHQFLPKTLTNLEGKVISRHNESLAETSPAESSVLGKIAITTQDIGMIWGNYTIDALGYTN